MSTQAKKDIQFFSPQQAAQQTAEIVYGAVETAFGLCWAALFNHALCALVFARDALEIEQSLHRVWPKSQQKPLPKNDPLLSTVVQAVLSDEKVPLVLVGTDFQQAIWQTLLKVPLGARISYQSLAKKAKKPAAIRAAASAVAANKIAVAVPCHRVIRSSGDVGQYRWGTDLKRQLLVMEGCDISLRA